MVNALADISYEEERRRERQSIAREEELRYARRGLIAELNRWGKWIEERIPREHYPSADSLNRFLNGAGGTIGGHRILCDDMPIGVYATHGRILRLHGYYQRIVWVKYVFRLKEDNTEWSDFEKCKIAGIPYGDFECTLKKIRNLILGITTI